MAKAQVSTEFLMVLSAVILIAAVVISIASQRHDQISSLRTRIYAKAEAEKVASGLNSVYILGDGSSKNVILQSSLKDNTPYSVSIYPDARVVLVNYSVQGKSKAYTSTIVTSNITGSLVNLNKILIIENQNGVVAISTQ